MPKVERGTFSQRRPAVDCALLGNVDVAVLTISQVDPAVKFEDRTRMVITFEEFPDHAYWPNVTSIGHLIDRFGDDTDEWISKPVALERVKTNNPQTKKQTDSMWVAAADQQDDLLRENKRAQRSGTKKGRK